MIKVGDRIICKDIFHHHYLTIGRVYIIIEIVDMPNYYGYRSMDGYRVINDDGRECNYEDKCFMSIKDIRKDKLKKLELL